MGEMEEWLSLMLGNLARKLNGCFELNVFPLSFSQIYLIGLLPNLNATLNFPQEK